MKVAHATSPAVLNGRLVHTACCSTRSNPPQHTTRFVVATRAAVTQQMRMEMQPPQPGLEHEGMLRLEEQPP
jgi:hypothetical protein